MKNNENGRSMVEMLGVLAIIGVLSAGGLAGYSKAMYKYRVNETMNQLTMIVSNIRTLFGSQNTYAGLNVGNSLTYGIITPDMAATKAADGKTVSKIQNPFKGDVVISAVGGRVKDDNEAFVIEYTGLPAEACVTMVTSDWGSAAGSGLVAIAAYSTDNTATTGTLNAGQTATADLLPADVFGVAGQAAAKVSITHAKSQPFTISNAVTACNPSTTGKDTSQNASVALKYY